MLVAAAAAAVWASPFRYDYANSGRYLMVAAKKMDPALFPGDPVVESMARFDSLFYRAMPAVLGEPGRMESALFKVYAGLKIALMTALFWWVRTLSKEPLAAVLVLAWCGQSASALLGGVPLFTGMATHNEAALVLGILAVVCAGRRLYWGFWLLVCLSLFVHSLVTVHLLACVVPVLLLRERAGRVGLIRRVRAKHAAQVSCLRHPGQLQLHAPSGARGHEGSGPDRPPRRAGPAQHAAIKAAIKALPRAPVRQYKLPVTSRKRVLATFQTPNT